MAQSLAPLLEQLFTITCDVGLQLRAPPSYDALRDVFVLQFVDDTTCEIPWDVTQRKGWHYAVRHQLLEMHRPPEHKA